MAGKKGRKCSMKNCTSFQHTHKHLSFFRFPKDPERCKIWIEKSERLDLAEKLNVHEDRVCEIHFEPSMFLNDYRNRLHQTAIPTLQLGVCPPSPPPPPPPPPRPVPKLKLLETPKAIASKSNYEPDYKRIKIDNSDDLLEVMEIPPVTKKKTSRLPPPQVYLDATREIRETGMSFRKAAEKYSVNYVTLRRFFGRFTKDNTIDNIDSAQQSLTPKQSQMQPQMQISAQIQSQIQTQLQRQMQQSPMQMQYSTPLQLQSSSLQKTQQQKGQQKTPQQKIQTQQLKQGQTSTLVSGYKRPRQIFSLEQEEELAVFVRDTSNYYNGMSSKDVRTLAFVYGICNQVDIPPGWRETHQASFDWCLGFIKRNKLTPMMITSHTFKNANMIPTLVNANTTPANETKTAEPVVIS